MSQILNQQPAGGNKKHMRATVLSNLAVILNDA